MKSGTENNTLRNQPGTQIPRKGEVINLKDYPEKEGKTYAFMVVKKALFSFLPNRVRFI